MNKILVTGGSSTVGQHLKKILPEAIYINSSNCDLTDQNDVRFLLESTKPHTVIHLAAKVGGILDNIEHPAKYFYQNIMMNTMLMNESYTSGVKRFIGILSTCIYPDILPNENYPLTEDMLFIGPPTSTNFSYGYAKRCLAVQTEAFNKEYGVKYNYIIPCNLYSEYDKSILNKSHFVNDLIRKIIKAKKGDNKIYLYGTGSSLRQNMYANDLAEIINICINKDITDSFNASVSDNLSIKRIAEIALSVCDAKDVEIIWDSSKPDGQYRRDVSNNKMMSLIPDFKFTSLEEGLSNVYNNIKNNTND